MCGDRALRLSRSLALAAFEGVKRRFEFYVNTKAEEVTRADGFPGGESQYSNAEICPRTRVMIGGV